MFTDIFAKNQIIKSFIVAFVIIVSISVVSIKSEKVYADAINSTDFVTTWKTDNPGTSNSTSITVPMVGGLYSVDWNNDGVYDQTGLSGPVTHNFGVAGTYTVRISGTPSQIRFARGGDRQKILSVEQWGTIVWASMARAFDGCTNVVVNAIDVPNLTNVTDMSSMFYLASSLGTSGNWSWDTSKVTNMSYLFWDATTFNGDISNWDTSNVTTMREMFPCNSLNCVFNTSIGGWNVSKVTNMDFMFYGQKDFNSNISNWDTSNVTSMYVMFANAPSFNASIGGWNVGKVTNMAYMFSDASGFNQNLGNWNVISVTDMTEMFIGVTLDTVKYDAILIGWDAKILKTGVPFHGGNSRYCLGSGARANMIGSDGWTITDGGYDCNSIIPATPTATPDLLTGSDSGISNSDNYTNIVGSQFNMGCSGSGNTVTLYVDGIANGTGVCIGLSANITAVPVLSGGVRVITYTESNVGGTSAQSPALSVTVDVISPIVSIVSGSSVIENGIYSATFTGSENLSGSIRYECQIGTGIWNECYSTGYSVGGLGYGNYVFSVRGIDVAGNVSSIVTRSFVYPAPVVGFGGGGSTPTPTSNVENGGETSELGEVIVGGLYNESIGDTCYRRGEKSTIYQGNDVSMEFRKAHQMMYSYGLTKWNGTKDYRPEDGITREEAARFMVEYARNVLCREKIKTYENEFSDIKESDSTLESYIKQSYEYGIFKGAEGRFKPKDVISSDELTAVIVRMVSNEFLNESDIKDWAKLYKEKLNIYAKTGILNVVRSNIAEVMYDVYRNNEYEWTSLGYVIK